jgi:AraC-like DNA-binding protein
MAAPAPPLRSLIAWYAGYRQEGVPPASHRGLPSPYLTLIITLDDPLVVVRHPDPRHPAGCYQTLIGGLHTSPAFIMHNGRQSGVQVALGPLGARTLLGMPAGELASVDVEGTEVFGALARQLHERLRQAGTWPARFAILDELLLDRADLSRQADPGVAEAWRLLVGAGSTGPDGGGDSGAIRVAAVAERVGWSPRYLQRRLRAETGLTPKAAVRVARFDRARRLLQRRAGAGQPPALAGLAAACGYYDQAHLAREFRELASCPPSAWLAEEFRNVQASPADPAEGSWA